MAGGPISTSAATTPAEVAALRTEALHVSQTLVSQRKEILPLLTHLEAAARQSGWRCERTMKPAQPAPSGLTNLTLHPVVFRLMPATEQPSGYYPRLLEWLNSIGTLEKRAEVVSIHIQATGAGITSAEIKLHFFSANAHEETAAK